MRLAFLACAATLPLASCASATRMISPAEASVVLDNKQAASFPLTSSALARFRLRYLKQRAAMTADLRSDLKKDAPSVDTPAFERALVIMAALPREHSVRRVG